MIIGVFDSGLGGLTVVKELKKIQSPLHIKYAGDTLHLPYGHKSAKAINLLSQDMAQYLYAQNIDLLIVACHSASSTSLQELKASFPIPVIGVIEPVLEELKDYPNIQNIGVIGTFATIKSHTYANSLTQRSIKTFELACPLFVPLVEEGWTNEPITDLIIDKYLNFFKKNPIDALILGCTHYPLLKTAIAKYLGPSVQLLDSAECCAKLIAQKCNLPIGGDNNMSHQLEISVTDYAKHFHVLAERFLGHKIEKITEISTIDINQSTERTWLL